MPTAVATTGLPNSICALAPQPLADRLLKLLAGISFLAILFGRRALSIMPQSSIASLCLSPEVKELLIRCVKTRPAIWDSSSEEYSDTNSRRRAYLEVAKILGDQNGSQYKPSEIQVEWKKMRDVFNRTLKKVMQSNGRYEIGWRYFDQIKFIASPEQQLFLRQKRRESSDNSPSIDPYGIRQFLESANTDENMSLFKDTEDAADTDNIGLDWIAARCVEQQNDAASAKNDESSSYDEPLTAAQTVESGEHLDDEDEDRPMLVKKRPRLQLNAKRAQPHYNDTFDAFGAFVASQLRAVSRRNRLAGANLQRAILETCLKSELEN